MTIWTQWTHSILFKAQEYLCLAIFEKPMIQVHGKTILYRIQIHNQSPWFKPMAIYLSKSQFSLAILKPNSHWQHQNPIFIGNIKAQFLLAIFKVQFLLAISKAQLTLVLLNTQANYLALFYRKPKVINTWQNTTSQLFHLKVQ